MTVDAVLERARPPVETRVISSGSDVSQGIEDLVSGAAKWRIWSSMAMEDLKRRYHRAAFGLLWVFFSFFAFVFVKAVVFDQFAGDIAFSFPMYLASGFLVWQFMNGVVTDGTDVFVSAANWLKGVPIPLSTFVFQSVVRNVVTAGYACMVVVLLMVYEGQAVTWGTLLALPGIAVCVVTSVWVQLLLGTVASRFRDFKHLVQTIMRITFFLTPVLWVPGALGRLGEYTYWNPFANFIEVIRMPLLYGSVDPFHWAYVGIFSSLVAVVSLIVFALCRHRIIYWV